MTSLLISGGGKEYRYLCDLVTHVIVGLDAEEGELAEARDLYEVPLIDQKWVHYSHQCNVLFPYPLIYILPF